MPTNLSLVFAVFRRKNNDNGAGVLWHEHAVPLEAEVGQLDDDAAARDGRGFSVDGSRFHADLVGAGAQMVAQRHVVLLHAIHLELLSRVGH